MKNLWENLGPYRFLRIFVNECTRASFNRVTIEGRENIPSGDVVILAPNHCNTLMDALVVLLNTDVDTCFGARADIFKKKIAGKLMRFFRIVPISRERDGLEGVRSNLAVFDEVVECLDHGMRFCLYSEGTHHPGYTVHPAKGGIFHLAQSASEKTGKKVWIVPVGLSYSDFYHFQNEVTMRYGEPIDAADILPLSHKERSEILTAKIQELVQRPRRIVIPESEKASRKFLSVLAAPLFAVFAVMSFPFWLTSELIIKGMKDKAWGNTVRFGVNLLLTPIMVIVWFLLGLLILNWKWAIAFVCFGILAPGYFHHFLDFYRTTFSRKMTF